MCALNEKTMEVEENIDNVFLNFAACISQKKCQKANKKNIQATYSRGDYTVFT
jgi:hypothetical protein